METDKDTILVSELINKSFKHMLESSLFLTSVMIQVMRELLSSYMCLSHLPAEGKLPCSPCSAPGSSASSLPRCCVCRLEETQTRPGQEAAGSVLIMTD